MTMPSTDAPSGRSRWVNAALIASLAVNLLFIGGFAKAFWHHRHGGPGGPSLMGFARDLPADRQKLVREDVKAAREIVRPLRKQMREAWSAANTVLAEEPFDKDKYKAAMDRVTEAEGRVKSAISAALADTAAKLTADERRVLKEWREKRRPHGFGRRHGGPGDAEGPDDKD